MAFLCQILPRKAIVLGTLVLLVGVFVLYYGKSLLVDGSVESNSSPLPIPFPARRKCVLLNPSGGLGSRIRTVSGYIIYVAHFGGGVIQIKWTETGACPMSLDDFWRYFQPPPPFHGVKIEYVERFSPGLVNDTSCERKNGHNIAWMILKNEGGVDPDAPFDFSPYAVASWAFQTTQEVVDRIAEFKSRVNWNSADVVGIHIRRTDMARSPDEEFITYMDEKLEEAPETRFCLATDDRPTRNRFRMRYGDKLLYLNVTIPGQERAGKVHKRATTMDHAVMDIFMLAECIDIKRSLRSSYSEAALKMLNARKEKNGELETKEWKANMMF